MGQAAYSMWREMNSNILGCDIFSTCSNRTNGIVLKVSIKLMGWLAFYGIRKYGKYKKSLQKLGYSMRVTAVNGKLFALPAYTIPKFDSFIIPLLSSL